MMKTDRTGKPGRKYLHCLFLLSAVVFLCVACSNPRIAAAIALTKTEGEVELIDRRGKDVAPRENLRLFDGYIMGTHASSYAWMDLDQTRLVKMDQESQIEIQKERKKLEILIQSGSLFFNIARPLEEDESLDIRTSSMMVGIRGTCGWVEVLSDEGKMRVYLLEGKVECSAGERQEMVQAGEMAVMTEDGEVSVSAFTARDIPAFVMEELQEDEDLREEIEKVIDLSEWDGSNPPEEEEQNPSEQDEENAAEQSGQNSQEVMDAIEQYKNVIRNIHSYQFQYSEPSKIRQCALVRMEREDRVPTLLLLSEHTEGVEQVYVFQYDPDSRIVHQGNDALSQGVAFAGGFRGGIGMMADGNGIQLTQWSSGSGQGSVERVTMEGSELSYVTEWEGRIDQLEGLEEFEDKPIEWHDIGSLEWMDSWNFDTDPYSGGTDARETDAPQTWEEPSYSPGNRPYTTEEETTAPQTSAEESSSSPALSVNGNEIAFSGTFNLYTHDQVVALQGSPDPNGSGGSETYRIIVLDTPQTMTLATTDPGSGPYAGTVRMISVESGALDAYAGQHLTFIINPDTTYWPSDTSLPVGQPSTSNVRVAN